MATKKGIRNEKKSRSTNVQSRQPRLPGYNLRTRFGTFTSFAFAKPPATTEEEEDKGIVKVVAIQAGFFGSEYRSGIQFNDNSNLSGAIPGRWESVEIPLR